MPAHWKMSLIIYKLIVNMLKTNDIVFHRPNPRRLVMPTLLTNIERVKFVKLLGYVLWITLVRVNQSIFFLTYTTSGYTFLIR